VAFAKGRLLHDHHDRLSGGDDHEGRQLAPRSHIRRSEEWHGILSGKPTVKGTFTITIIASDGLFPTAMQTFVLTID
jgi:hypothetical protein